MYGKMHDMLEKLAILQLIAYTSDRHDISCLVIVPIFDYSEAIYRQVSVLFLMSWMLSNGIAKLVLNCSLGTYYCKIPPSFLLVFFFIEKRLEWLQIEQ